MFYFNCFVNHSLKTKTISIPINNTNNKTNPIINFYLKPETYERAFSEAGFSHFEWKNVLLAPNERGNPYWDEFFSGDAPFIAMLAKK